MEKTFGEKIVLILTSTRFWLLTIAAIAMVIGLYSAQYPVLEIVRNWLLAVAGIGTLDSVASRIGGK